MGNRYRRRLINNPLANSSLLFLGKYFDRWVSTDLRVLRTGFSPRTSWCVHVASLFRLTPSILQDSFARITFNDPSGLETESCGGETLKSDPFLSDHSLDNFRLSQIQ